MSILDGAKKSAQAAAQTIMKKAVELAPDSWMPGGHPDPLINLKHGLIGASVSRIDGPLRVKGQVKFAAEFPLERMTYAALAFSTIAKGRIVALEVGSAEEAPGVVAVMTYRNAPRLKPMPLFMSAAKAAGGDNLPILQDDRIHWNGQPIAVVIAETQEQADHATSLICATYAEEAAVTSFAAAKEQGTEAGLFMGEPLLKKIGDAETALAAAAISVDNVYTTPRHNHNAIELHAATVAWNGDELLVHDATQMVSHTAWSLAHIFDIDESKVRVTSPNVGGGFGGKGLWQHQALAAAAAKFVDRPVRIMLSREGVFRIVGGRSLTEQRVALGAATHGRLEAIVHTGTVTMTPQNAFPEPFILPTMSAYAAPNISLDVEVARLNMLATTFMRAPGEAVGSFGLESAMDELAVALNMDPVELRIRNEPEKDPVDGKPFSARHAVKAWRDGAERFGWSKRSATPGAVRDGEWRIGMGCASATYPYHRMPGGVARITVTRRVGESFGRRPRHGDGDGDGSHASLRGPSGTRTRSGEVRLRRLGLTRRRAGGRLATDCLRRHVRHHGAARIVC